MATIKAGTYVFVEEPTITEAYNQSLNYKAHYLTAENVYATNTYNAIQLSTTVTWSGTVTFRAETEHPKTGYVGNANRWQSSPDDSSNFHSTDNTKLRTIIIETDQTVADNFYTWFTANTTKQQLSVDLTTLSGWANLTPGNHTIKIVAKGTGYRDSEKSVGVSVTKAAEVYTDCLTFTGETSEFTLKATYKEWNGTLQWSTDHNTWTTLNGTEAMQSVNKKLYLRGKGNTKFCNEDVFGVRLVLSAKADCSGNIQTLLDWENPPTSISTVDCYRALFKNCTNLTSAPELPATTLSDGCYAYMFIGCTNLTSAPFLPATTLNKECYSSMFEDCTKLKVNTSSGNKIFTCPSSIPRFAVSSMFYNTGGTFKGSPTAGNTYYWTE